MQNSFKSPCGRLKPEGDLIGDLENKGCVSVADEALSLLIRLQALGSGPVSASARFRDGGFGALWGREGHHLVNPLFDMFCKACR